ncbi:phage tail protein I [Halodesulfovibrio marinisediminis]|uniref:Phage tail protein, P2 protein I family n=1 Tax=Halodesulfovibrio marinisediminis DSM 17456 TaxID=1121457 RepID=A0A1N6I1G1_9BACT|nr:phage tail protein I [Halodesulfovibrio marinisediminis]SIO25789.1 phage tail protein, P2 protein I family [Halodesulfovibrio marinisediminis DSM 17456]
MTLLPSNATKYERALEKTCARSFSLPVLINTLRNPFKCPKETLPWLAYEWSVDEWNEEWSEEQKRQVVAQAIAVHKKKGTRGAVEDAINALGYNINAIEWWEQSPKGKPATYQLDITADGRGVSEDVVDGLLKVVARTKNTRSHMSKLRVTGSVSETFYSGACVIAGDTVAIEPLTPEDIETSGVYVAACSYTIYESMG